MVSNAAIWRRHLVAWRDSGLSQASYCRQHDVSLPCFGYWRGKLDAVPSPSTKALLSIVVSQVSMPMDRMAVELANGLRVPLSVGSDAVQWMPDGMLSPTGWWLVTAPMDLRCGMDRLLVHVRETLGATRSMAPRTSSVIARPRVSRCCVVMRRAHGWRYADGRTVASSGRLPVRAPGRSPPSSLDGCVPVSTGNA
jgi:hypothetical protein